MDRTPRMYADVISTKESGYSSYADLEIQWNSPDPYEVIKKLGHGKYSEVFEGIDNRNDSKIVIKLLRPVKPERYSREVKILQNLAGGPNIIKLLEMVKDPVTKCPALIFEHVNNTHFRTLYPTLSDFEIRYYLFELLRALEYSHSMGIMHRDVKPHNIMIDHTMRDLKLIDWGLAEFYKPWTTYNVGVASRYFKGPELLVDDESYTYSLDMWSFGALMAGMVFHKDPFFHGWNNQDQLLKIVKVLGTKELLEYVGKYKIEMEPELRKQITRRNSVPLLRFVTPEVQPLVSVEALDLIVKALRYDPIERILPAEAMKHPYFYPVLNMWEKINSGEELDEDSQFAETARILKSKLKN